METNDHSSGHYLCLDQNDFLDTLHPGGSEEIEKYKLLGYIVSDVLVFEKK
jgi:hypothetical protein